MELSQFSRSEMLLGSEATVRLRGSHAAVFGLGGVGSYTAEALARAGVGELTLVDSDTLNLTNLNRQLYALHSTLGEKKTEVAARRILDINPECRVHVIDGFCLPENVEEFFKSRYTCVADAVDTVSAKLSLALEAQKRGIAIVSCMGTGNKLDPTLFRVSDISQTDTCPLCRVMRRELKARGVERLKVVWSPEVPLKPAEGMEGGSGRSTPGSVSFVPPVAGMIMAGELIKDILKNEEHT